MHRFALILLLVTAAIPLRSTAAAQSTKVPSYSGETAEFHFLLARYFESSGKLDEAIAEYQRALQLAPRSAEIRAALAGLYARDNRALEALDAAEEALKYDATNEEANRIIGSIYAALAEQKRRLRPSDDPAQYLAKAIAALERGRGPSTDLNVELTLGRLYLRAGRHKEAITALGRVFEQQPEYSEGGMLLSAAQEAAGQLDAATTTVARTVRETPSFFRGYVRLIELYERQRRWKEAADTYATARGINPRADLAGGHAAALMNAGSIKEAQDVLKAALDRKGAPDAGLLYLMAETQRRQGDFAAAAATAQKIRAAFPDDPRSLVIEGQLHLAQGRKKEALAAFATLVKRLPNNPAFVYQYAQLLEEDGNIAEAERVLRDLLSRDPMDANALNSLGYMFADRGERLDEAVELLQRALKIEPGNPSFLDSLGWAYFKQGKLDLADSPLTEAAVKMPENSVIQDHLGDLRFRQQRFADAAVAWERALAGDRQSIDKAVIEKKLKDARSRIQKK